MSSRGPIIAEISGKPTSQTFSNITAATFGKSKLTLHDTKLVENTKQIISRRHCELLLSQIDSAEITTKGNPMWLVLGLLTLALYGLGLIFFIVFLFSKHRFLIVRSGNNAQAIVLRGPLAPYEDFMTQVLDAADLIKTTSHQ